MLSHRTFVISEEMFRNKLEVFDESQMATNPLFTHHVWSYIYSTEAPKQQHN